MGNEIKVNRFFSLGENRVTKNEVQVVEPIKVQSSSVKTEGGAQFLQVRRTVVDCSRVDALGEVVALAASVARREASCRLDRAGLCIGAQGTCRLPQK